MDIIGVEIGNFQSHEHTKIDFTNGINVLVGPSDSGKSAVLRAIKWNLTNSPSGNEFVKEGANEASVTIHFKDGHSVERVRGKTGSKNTYTLLKDGVVLEEYTGFGNKVPKDILEVTRINPDFSFNFANQLEAPFLLSDSPKVRAETIGNLEELGKIDGQITKLNEDIRDTKAEERSTKKRMQEIEQERTNLLQELSVSRVKAETIQFLKDSIIEKSRIYEALKNSSQRIRSLETELVKVRSVIEQSERILKHWDPELPDQVQQLVRFQSFVVRLLQLREESELITYLNEDKLTRLMSLSNSTTELVTSYRRLVQLKSQLESNGVEIQRMNNFASEKVAAADLTKVDVEVSRFNEIFKRKVRLQEIKSLEKELTLQVDQSKIEIEKLLNQFVEALQEAKTCPTCLQDTEEVTVKEVEHSL